MAKNSKQEDKALKISILALVGFSLLGIVFGILLSSDVVFYDGIFSLIGVATSFATLKISRYIHKNDHFNFPFGKETLVPVVVLIQYLIMSGFLLLVLVEAVTMLLQGGNKVQLGNVILYMAVSTGILYGLVRKMRQLGHNSHSSLIESEVIQWEISLKQSLWNLGSYLVSLIFVRLSYESIVAYVDPAILLLFVGFTSVTVIREIRVAFKEVIGMRTISQKLHAQIEDSVKAMVQKYQMRDWYLRVRKVGGMVVVEVDFLVDRDFRFGDVYQQDLIREEFEKSLSALEYDLWLSITFTTQYKWMD